MLLTRARRIDQGRFAGLKRAALEEHVSQIAALSVEPGWSRRAPGFLSFFLDRSELFFPVLPTGARTATPSARGARAVKVWFVLPTFPRVPSGGALVVYQYASWLVDHGHKVTVFHRDRLPAGVPAAIRARLHRQWENLLTGGITSRVRWTTIDSRVRMISGSTLPPALARADVVAPTFWTTVRSVLDLHPDHRRVVHLVQGYETWAGPPANVEQTLRLPIRKIVVSDDLRVRLVGLGVPATDITFISNGIDLTTFRCTVPVDHRPRRVAFQASEVPVKACDVAADVVHRVRRELPDTEFVAFGPGRRPAVLPRVIPYRRALLQAELSRSVYNRSAVFLCSSRSEGWGLPIAEAMACGAAVVSTRNGGVENFGVDGDSALLVDVDDAEGLARAVVRLLVEADLRRRLVRRGLEVAGRLDHARSARQIQARLAETAEGRTDPRGSECTTAGRRSVGAAPVDEDTRC